jgi:hypothetical protein
MEIFRGAGLKIYPDSQDPVAAFVGELMSWVDLTHRPYPHTVRDLCLAGADFCKLMTAI